MFKCYLGASSVIQTVIKTFGLEKEEQMIGSQCNTYNVRLSTGRHLVFSVIYAIFAQ